MSKISNNRILNTLLFGLGILVILAFGIIAFMPSNTEAYTERYGYARPYSNDFVDTFNDSNYGGSTSLSPASSNTNGSVLGASTTKKATPAKSASKPTVTPKEEFNALTANAINGANGFFPSGIVQWIFFAILILIIVILARKLFGLEDKYHSTPLKHS